MAATQTSEQFFQSATQATTHSLTIPSGCDAIVVCVTGATNDFSTAQILDRLNFNAGTGMHFDHVGSAIYGSGFNVTQVGVYIMTASSPNWPGAGTHTLTIRARNTVAEGLNRSVLYCSGVDQSSPIVGTDDHVGSDDGTSFTSSIGGVGADDLGVVCAYNFNNVGGGPTVNGNSQTEIRRAVSFNSADIGVAKKAGTGTLQASASELVALAFVLRAAASAPEEGEPVGLSTTPQLGNGGGAAGYGLTIAPRLGEGSGAHAVGLTSAPLLGEAGSAHVYGLAVAAQLGETGAAHPTGLSSSATLGECGAAHPAGITSAPQLGVTGAAHAQVISVGPLLGTGGNIIAAEPVELVVSATLGVAGAAAPVGLVSASLIGTAGSAQALAVTTGAMLGESGSAVARAVGSASTLSTPGSAQPLGVVSGPELSGAGEVQAEPSGLIVEVLLGRPGARRQCRPTRQPLPRGRVIVCD